MRVVLLALFAAAVTLGVCDAALAPARGEWQAVQAVNDTQPLRLTLLLRQRNLGELNRIFWSVSDPDSMEYGKFLTHEQLADLIAPPAADVDRVTTFLRADAGCGRVQLVNTRDIAVCHDIPAGRVAAVFAVDLFWYQRGAERHVRPAPGKPVRIPGAIADVVESVPELDESPVAELVMHTAPQVRKLEGERKAQPKAQSPTARGPPYTTPYTPPQLRDLYSVPDTLVGNNSLATAQAIMTTGSYVPTDLHNFLGNFTPSAAGEDIKQIIDFTNNPSNPYIETNVDVEWTMGMAPKVYTYLWGLTGSVMRGDAWVNIAVSYFAASNPPQLWTVSYNSGGEAQQSANTNIDRMNTEFQKMGSSGATLIFSSGDKGAGCNSGDANQAFMLQFPSSSPYITVVGASKTNEDGSQEACPISAGGFSNMFAMPPYQTTQVSHYLTTAVLPPEALFNRTGRAIPDLSSEGCDVRFFWQGYPVSLSGTSVSTPMTAGILSLINLKRAAKGLPTLGFANPLLYNIKAALPNAFNQITVGKSNRPAPCTSMGWNQGWNAAAGWNPITGLGTPKFDVLSDAALNLPRRFRL